MAAHNTIMPTVPATVVGKELAWADIKERKKFVHETGHVVVARLDGAELNGIMSFGILKDAA